MSHTATVHHTWDEMRYSMRTKNTCTKTCRVSVHLTRFLLLTLRQLNITNYNGLVNIETPLVSHGCIRETYMSVYENRKHANFVFKQLKRLSNSTSCKRG
jgi:hypothetical protein